MSRESQALKSCLVCLKFPMVWKNIIIHGSWTLKRIPQFFGILTCIQCQQTAQCKFTSSWPWYNCKIHYILLLLLLLVACSLESTVWSDYGWRTLSTKLQTTCEMKLFEMWLSSKYFDVLCGNGSGSTSGRSSSSRVSQSLINVNEHRILLLWIEPFRL